MPPFRELPEALRGRAGEQTLARLLQARGWYIIPSYDYSGVNGEKAPTIQGAHDGIVLPDLGIARAGQLKWAEVKAKEKPMYYRLGDIVEHGIGRRHWEHYKRCQLETGAHVWLFIIEERNQIILFESIDHLGEPYHYHGDKMDRGGMVFWRRDAFKSRIILNELPGLSDPKLALAFELPDVARAWLMAAIQRGLEFRLDANRILVRPKALMSAADETFIRQHHTELLTCLRNMTLPLIA